MDKLLSPRSVRTVMLLVVCLGLMGCSDSGEQKKPQIEEAALGVEALRLIPEAWSYHVDGFGQLNVAETVSIGVESAGVVTQVNVVEGQKVAIGDLLFSLDDLKEKSRFEQAQASVTEAKTNLAQASRELERFEQLSVEGATSESHLQRIKADYDNAISRLAQSDATLNIARKELLDRQVLSPVDGVVASEFVEKGQRAQPGDILARIQASGAFQVETYVNELEVAQIHIGLQGNVRVAGLQFVASVESIAATSNSKTGNYAVKLRLQGDQSMLREGMSVKVSVPVTTNQKVIKIPSEALVYRERERVVFLERDGAAEQRSVELGSINAESIAVVSGVEADEKLIISSLPLLTDGTAVKSIVMNDDSADEALIENTENEPPLSPDHQGNETQEAKTEMEAGEAVNAEISD